MNPNINDRPDHSIILNTTLRIRFHLPHRQPLTPHPTPRIPTNPDIAPRIASKNNLNRAV